MEEIIQVLKEMNKISWLDIIAIITPIILSVIAIVISICTMKKQNKIALFDKRLDVYDELTSLKIFYDNLEFCINANNLKNKIGFVNTKVLEDLIVATLKINPQEEGRAFIKIYIARLDRVLTSSWLLFDFIDKKDIQKLFGTSQAHPSKMNKLFNALFSYKECELNVHIAEAKVELKIFTDKYLEKIEKQLKL